MSTTGHTGSKAMNAETLEALRGSIAKWEGIVAGTVKDQGPANCSLCLKFHSEYREDYERCCVGCPVMERTGEPGCGETPYQDFDDAQEIGDAEGMALHAKRELEFLISLLPKEALTDDPKTYDCDLCGKPGVCTKHIVHGAETMVCETCRERNE